MSSNNSLPDTLYRQAMQAYSETLLQHPQETWQFPLDPHLVKPFLTYLRKAHHLNKQKLANELGDSSKFYLRSNVQKDNINPSEVFKLRVWLSSERATSPMVQLAKDGARKAIDNVRAERIKQE